MPNSETGVESVPSQVYHRSRERVSHPGYTTIVGREVSTLGIPQCVRGVNPGYTSVCERCTPPGYTSV